jgi:hypothetical protein
LGKYEITRDDIYVYNDQDIPSAYNFAVRNSQYLMTGGFLHFQEENGEQFANMSMFGMSMALYDVGRRIYLSSDCSIVRNVDEFNPGEAISYYQSELLANYNLKINNVLPYNVWPEVLQTEIDRAESNGGDELIPGELSVKKVFLQKVRTDFREKEKVDVHRDIYTQIS